MSTLDEMWDELAKVKPPKGAKRAWARMLEERTAEACWAATDVASIGAATDAAGAAYVAVDSFDATAIWAEAAISYARQAQDQP